MTFPIEHLWIPTKQTLVGGLKYVFLFQEHPETNKTKTYSNCGPTSYQFVQYHPVNQLVISSINPTGPCGRCSAILEPGPNGTNSLGNPKGEMCHDEKMDYTFFLLIDISRYVTNHITIYLYFMGLRNQLITGGTPTTQKVMPPNYKDYRRWKWVKPTKSQIGGGWTFIYPSYFGNCRVQVLTQNHNTFIGEWFEHA